MGLFANNELASIHAAVGEEITEAQKGADELWLDIDAIELITQAAGRFVYRLLLSRQVRLQPEQAITFTTRSKDKIKGTVVSSTDSELVVECESALPDDTRLQHIEFDPSFIYNALRDFIDERLESANPITRALISKQLLVNSPKPISTHNGLNPEQNAAIAAMRANPLHLLWGPPGTGKTTTVGAAVVAWMREGKSVLVVSTSNAAVDVAVKSILKRIEPNERKLVVRVGTSTDPEVSRLTLGSKFGEKNAGAAFAVSAAQAELRNIADTIAARTSNTVELQKLFEKRKPLEATIAKFNERVEESSEGIFAQTRVYAATLAKMTLDKNLKNRQFDVVVVDEASMVSFLNAVAATLLAKEWAVFAGDPKQLPPIVQSERDEAIRWFGTNVFKWIGLSSARNVDHLPASLLKTQYRMTHEIGGFVSRLSYDGQLVHGRDKNGLKVTLIEVPFEWQTKLWSARERSYYQPASALILHALFECLGGEKKDMLLLSPYRSQQSLLAALAFDLKTRFPAWSISASTIHRSQGSERYSVIVDLTTHDAESPANFFDDEVGEFLFNVAISRASDQLYVIAAPEMLAKLVSRGGLWAKLNRELSTNLTRLTVSELLEDVDPLPSLASLIANPVESGMSAVCCCGKRSPTSDEINSLNACTASRKLLVASDCPTDGKFIFRQPTASCVEMFCAHGHVALPFNGQLFGVRSPSLNRAIWRVAFSHLADEEVNPNEAKRFFCPTCVPGSLSLRHTAEGWFLMCSEYPRSCTYRRRLSLEDAKAKVRLTGMTCPQGHPLTVRTSAKGMFLGCENYPRCDFTENLRVLEGT